MGTLEARLMPSDVIILGGLNEGIWPAQADPGPWLNRTMREKLGLPQPERDIGLAGHDFEQAFCNPKTYLTWSNKLGGKPANPSRWLLRLATVLAAAHVQRDTHQAEKILYWAQSLDGSLTAESLPVPISKPAPTPPSALRPRHFSVTEVEKLIRNPYAVYAMRILKLDPLPAFGPTQDAALRGSLFHDAVAAWNKQPKRDSPTLLAIGKHHFIPFADIAEIRDFWWPHFQRVAEFLGREEPALNGGLLNTYAELSGKITFDIEGASHELRARADRIDLLAGGQARRRLPYVTRRTRSGASRRPMSTASESIRPKAASCWT